jgi:hypothetical protein
MSLECLQGTNVSDIIFGMWPWLVFCFHQRCKDPNDTRRTNQETSRLIGDITGSATPPSGLISILLITTSDILVSKIIPVLVFISFCRVEYSFSFSYSFVKMLVSVLKSWFFFSFCFSFRKLWVLIHYDRLKIGMKSWNCKFNQA